MFERNFGAVAFVVGLGVLVFAGALLTTPFSPPLTPILAISVVLLSVAYVSERLYGDPGDPVKWLPEGEWEVLSGVTDSNAFFHHVIVKQQGKVRYAHIPVSQLKLEEVRKVGGFEGYPTSSKILLVTRDGDWRSVEILEAPSAPPTPGFAS